MIEVKALNYTYPGQRGYTLKDLEFGVERGEIFGFLGPSGAGKSTTQKLLIGILADFDGSIRVFGEDIQRLGRHYYEKIGVSFETPNLYTKLSARENLELFASFYSRTCMDTKRLLALLGLENDSELRVSSFSKGMRMRLNLCRALLHGPELLFLDEPTSGQDPINARRIKDLIKEQKDAGKTIFLTTHNMSVAEELCDRLAFIVDGSLERIDSPRRLKMRYAQRRVRLEYHKDGKIRYTDFPLEGLSDNDTFLRILKDFPLETIHSQEPSMEDIFLHVTGRKLT